MKRPKQLPDNTLVTRGKDACNIYVDRQCSGFEVGYSELEPTHTIETVRLRRRTAETACTISLPKCIQSNTVQNKESVRSVSNEGFSISDPTELDGRDY
jgi:hypothetical protein